MAITVNSTTPTTGLLTSMGVGSGLDVATLVSQLVAARKAPQQNQITSQAASANTQLSALGQINAALSALQSAMASISDGSAFSAHNVTSSDTDVLNATATGNAVAGNYKIEVTQLASALKASSGAFTDSSTQVGTGTLTITVGGQAMNLSIDGSNGSLASIRDAINKASDNPGVSATIVNGTDGAHLVLSGTRTGAANGFKVSSSGGDGGLAALNYDPAASSGNGLSVINAASDALYTIDGLAANSAGNSVSTAIDGLTLNLSTLGISTVSVADDPSKATSALTNLVSTYNSFVGIYQNLTKYDATSKTAGAMIGDATLNGINSTLSRIIGGSANGATLSSIGISLQVDGTLKLDNDKLSAALGDGGKQVGDLFGGDNGFSAQLGAQLTQWVGDGGVLAGRTDSISQELKDLGDQQTALNARMDSLTARYQAQFTALDTLMSKLNSTSTYLQQQFDALTNANKK
ncbi:MULTISPECIES: flagellar filament capping protein FliD [unclassified Rhodanobacter]|uniref:flagellar filament capping protein FliD n=1 Tax=unclassified Rhodanobacter TaxID=2621553 RepID=UPI001BDFAD1D|nr:MULTISPECIES: flagellar filament capping protein FliD [unclassified Rhodanobacter]MBT2145249.1 flagellar filament capping protein FliD [Rhodanobacter sp. LX-99]MBT2149294.1 flagellar filament capping protein FliD [Rhodanobacter sp. LX-100]